MAGARPLPFWSPAEVEAALPPAIAQLHARRVIAYPTETLYGFGGAVDQESVRALVELKGRPRGKPFLLLIAGSAMLERLGLHLTAAASSLAARHWPGALTLVLPGGERRVPRELRGPEGGVAVRWTPHRAVARLILAYGDPITSTSANRPGTPPALAAQEIMEQWSDAVNNGSLVVLDGGTLQLSPPSTIVDCTSDRPRLIRAGAIPVDTLRESVPALDAERGPGHDRVAR
jgi:L-threonylcarbamoyladenylate synthase